MTIVYMENTIFIHNINMYIIDNHILAQVGTSLQIVPMLQQV
jgi:hypothetical protein